MISLKLLLVTPILHPLMVDVQNSAGCAKYKNFHTRIEYEVVQEPTQYIYHFSRRALTQQSQNSMEDWKKKHEGHSWLSGLGKNTKWHVNGVNKGAMSVGTEVQLVAKPYDKYGVYYCPYVKSLKVTIKYSSEIFIASEIKKGTCRFNAVDEHELKHHTTNWTVVQTLGKRMEADTRKIIKYLESKYVRREKVQARFENIKQGIRDALHVYGEEIFDRMDEFNEHVDTPDEYRRVSQMCK